jgi:hypothetical protein
MDTEQMPDMKERYALDVLVFDATSHWPEGQSHKLMPYVLSHQNVRSVGIAHRLDEVSYCLRNGRVNTIIIDPLIEEGDKTTMEDLAQFIVRVRREFPNVVFVVYATDKDFRKLCNIERRFEHYFFIGKYFDMMPEFQESVTEALTRCVEWHSGLFEYDIAISFAGEDRETARELASALTSLGARVFFDEYERSTMLGKDLYTHLHQIYSKYARYTVILVSKAYASKLWTSHEHQSAQERAFKQGMMEYILPIRIDDTPLPGLMETIGYSSIESGIVNIAEQIASKLWKVDPNQRPSTFYCR